MDRRNYSNDIDSMFKYEDLLKLTDNNFNLGKEKYITGDTARLGKRQNNNNDMGRFSCYRYNRNETIQQTHLWKHKQLMDIYNIPPRNVCNRRPCRGGGAVDQLPNVKSFINNSRPLEVIVN